VTTKVRDFISMAFDHIGLKISWSGSGVEGIGVLESINKQKFNDSVENIHHQRYTSLLEKVLVKVDPRYFRPTEVDLLLGDPNKSKTKLNWKPEYDLPALVEEMMDFGI